MQFREAQITDIPGIQVVRNAVKENRLSDPSKVTDQDCEDYMTKRGRGWVCEIDGKIAGFAIVDLLDQNVWALFVHPDHEGKGIGRKLHDEMLDWYFSKTTETIWLGTAPGTRAENFYMCAGWTNCGQRPNGEMRFEYAADRWQR
jgi:GNAT superfamily N-acetyltransferase